MKKFIVLEGGEPAVKFGLHLEDAEFGVVGIVNCHFNLEGEYEILLTDCQGENFYAKMNDNPFSFSLPPEFSLSGMIMADIFKDGGLIASGVSQEHQAYDKKYEKFLQSTEEYLAQEPLQTPDEVYAAEAKYYTEKARELFGSKEEKSEKNSAKKQQEPMFFDAIKQDFNFLYSAGEDDSLLKRKFKNSRWKKVDISGEVYILGKIYASAGVMDVDLPAFVALAVPTTLERANREKPLGEKAKFYHANIYDNFGFLVLVESSVSGKVINF